jgi:hypothetical protein
MSAIDEMLKNIFLITSCGYEIVNGMQIKGCTKG